MTLGFKQQIKNKPTHFPEKIMVGLWAAGLVSISKAAELARHPLSPFPDTWKYIDTLRKAWGDFKPKITTIRADPKNQWRADRDIHMVVNNRSAKRYQFAPTVPCVSTQYFQVLYDQGRPTVYIGAGKEDAMPFYIDDKQEGVVYGEKDMECLAANDGFDSVADFFDYFSKDFNGTIIHWTDLRY